MNDQIAMISIGTCIFHVYLEVGVMTTLQQMSSRPYVLSRISGDTARVKAAAGPTAPHSYTGAVGAETAWSESGRWGLEA